MVQHGRGRRHNHLAHSGARHADLLRASEGRAAPRLIGRAAYRRAGGQRGGGEGESGQLEHLLLHSGQVAAAHGRDTELRLHQPAGEGWVCCMMLSAHECESPAQGDWGDVFWAAGAVTQR